MSSFSGVVVITGAAGEEQSYDDDCDDGDDEDDDEDDYDGDGDGYCCYCNHMMDQLMRSERENLQLVIFPSCCNHCKAV